MGHSPGAVPWVRSHPLRWPQFPHMDHWLRCPPKILPRVQFRVQGLVIPPVHLSVHPSPLKYPLKASGCPAPTSAADAQFQGDPLPHSGENMSREGREDQQAGGRPRPAHLPSPCPARGQPRCPELESGRQEHRQQGWGEGWMGGCVGDVKHCSDATRYVECGPAFPDPGGGHSPIRGPWRLRKTDPQGEAARLGASSVAVSIGSCSSEQPQR